MLIDVDVFLEIGPDGNTMMWVKHDFLPYPPTMPAGVPVAGTKRFHAKIRVNADNIAEEAIVIPATPVTAAPTTKSEEAGAFS